MAKSLRSKKEKRLRAIRREIVQPIYDKKDAAKLAALEAALAAPKLPVKSTPFASSSSSAMDTAASTNTIMDVEMDGAGQAINSSKPSGMKLKKKLKLAQKKKGGKGKFKRRHI